MQIYLSVIIKSKSEHTQVVKQKLQNLVVQTRLEKACLQYDLHQSVDDPQVFVFYEVWENQAGLDSHNQQSYLVDFSKVASELLESPPALYRTKLI